MFLAGGTAFSGTTLLSVLLTQGDMVCLDEPGFGKPAQRHRGIPVLQSYFPRVTFPELPEKELSLEEAYVFFTRCARAVEPARLGLKTCNYEFVTYAKMFRDAGFPVIAIVRDIRDALVRPLPEWLTEEKLNHAYRRVWTNIALADVCIRYENLVARPEETLREVSGALGRRVEIPASWSIRGVVKLDRHELLRTGTISTERVGLWRASDLEFLPETHETARMMGYGA
jgi:hypothetical protein